MNKSNAATKAGAIFFLLWGLVHVLGAALQLAALRSGGGDALARMLSTARPYDDGSNEVAAAFMGLGSYQILWIGVLVAVIAISMNWRNQRLGFCLNLSIVGLTDLGLVIALLLPGYMAWSDGMVGISLYLLAAGFSIAGLNAD
jgi:hypothetical protein